MAEVFNGAQAEQQNFCRMLSAIEYFDSLRTSYPEAAKQFWRQVRFRVFGDMTDEGFNELMTTTVEEVNMFMNESVEYSNGQS